MKLLKMRSSMFVVLVIMMAALGASSARAQIRQDKLYIDDGTGLFSIIKSNTLGGAGQTVWLPNAGSGATTYMMLPNAASATAWAAYDLFYASSSTKGLMTRLAMGTSNQVLSVNGAGTAIVWATPVTGGLTNFTESVTTAAPNATVSVVQLLANNGATNVDVALTPKGTGALTAQVADNGTTGGNKRGPNAVDWQTNRGVNSEVASNSYSTIGGGQSNTASGNSSTVAGGDGNVASNLYATVGGGATNTASNTNATVSGGLQNTASGGYPAIPGGENLTLSGHDDFGFLSDNSDAGRPMSIAADNTSVFGNTDLWLANNDNTARSLYFYAPWNTTGAFPSTDKYVAIDAGIVTASQVLTLPLAQPTTNQVLVATSVGVTEPYAVTLGWVTAAGTGTVTSVDMSLPSILSVSGNPITTTGTLAVSLVNETGNTVFASPANGRAARRSSARWYPPIFRAASLPPRPSRRQPTALPPLLSRKRPAPALPIFSMSPDPPERRTT